MHFVQAFQEGKYYPDYVWILYGWYSNNWWTRTPTPCNSSALLTALERAIILQSYPNFAADDIEVHYYKHEFKQYLSVCNIGKIKYLLVQ